MRNHESDLHIRGDEPDEHFSERPRCNSIRSVMMKQMEPETDIPYHVECRKCHLEGDDAPTEAGAEQAWVKTVATYNGEDWHGEV